MLAISHTRPSRKVTPNILPCSIKHNGPINTDKRYWSPTPSSSSNDDVNTVYFRGRQLLSRTVKLPTGYQGVLLQKSDQLLPSKPPTAEALRRMEEDHEDDEMEMQKPVEVKMLQPIATYEEIVIWGHEVVPEDDDVYVKGVREWIGFAEAMHSWEKPEEDEKAA